MATETKEHMVGAFIDVPANSIEIVDLAYFAIEEENKRQNSTLELVGVIRAKQQLVAGMNYHITLEARDGLINKKYEAKLWVREWLNSKELLEFKPLSVPSTTIPGAFTDVPANSIEIENLARFAVHEHNQKENANLELVGVISAQQQVVAGTNYHITLEAKDGLINNKHEALVWVRDLNPKELLEFKPLSVPINPILGGPTDVPANNILIENLARFAVHEHNKKENANLELVGVIRAKQHVVAGLKYHITLDAKDGSINKKYEATVWVRGWLNSKELLEFKPLIVPIDVPTNSIEIENLARFAVHEHNKKENANLRLVGVISAKQQVVEGFIYYMTLETKDGETKNVYETKVWIKSWLNFMELVEFKQVKLNSFSVSV